MTLFVLIRHGETDYNRTGRYQGQTEITLNERGRQQCRLLAARLAGEPLDVIYSSDLGRAQECARLIAGGRPVALDPRLREVDVGRVVGLTAPEIAAREPAFWAAFQRDREQTPYPGGESAVDVLRRAREALAAIEARYPDGRVGVVTHGGVIALVVGEAMGAPLAYRGRLVTSNCGITVLERKEGRVRLHSFNDTAHLNGAVGELLTDV